MEIYLGPATRLIGNVQAMRPLAEGGLGVIDVETMQEALNMYWIQAYLQSGCGKGCITAKLTTLS